MKRNTLWVLGIVSCLFVVFMIKGCDSGEKQPLPVAPDGSEPQRVTLRLTSSGANPAAKATGLTLAAVGVDDQGNAIGPQIDPVTVQNPTFPLNVEMTFFRPPCRYRVSVTTQLTRDPARSRSAVIDICTGAGGALPLDTFEEMQIRQITIDAPDSIAAGQAFDAVCRISGVDAPDSARFPLSATLSEQEGQAVTDRITEQRPVSGNFPDPYPLDNPQTQRVLTCTISDGRSPAQRVERRIARVVPTPTPLPTGMPTPTPTPDPCVVQNENDNGIGSLRQVLVDAVENDCRTITFATGVTTIILESELIPRVMTLTIDGGTGVTISGNNKTGVFYTTTGTRITFAGLTITQGNSGDREGGGLYNAGGIITIAANTTVTGNTSNDSGGGIANFYDGIITILGTVSNNTANESGGGIIINSGTITRLSGTVSGNRANRSGGGIAGPVELNPGNLIQGNHSDNDDTGGETGGGISGGGCPPGANYGTGNYRGSGTAIIDNCNGNP